MDVDDYLSSSAATLSRYSQFSRTDSDRSFGRSNGWRAGDREMIATGAIGIHRFWSSSRGVTGVPQRPCGTRTGWCPTDVGDGQERMGRSWVEPHVNVCVGLHQGSRD